MEKSKLPQPVINFQEKTTKPWRDTSPTVVPGLTMSIGAMLARQKAGIPNNVSTRTLETYFKNHDLTDIQNLNEHYLKLAEDVQNKLKAQKDYRNEQIAKNKREREEILAYLQKAKEHVPNP